MKNILLSAALCGLFLLAGCGKSVASDQKRGILFSGDKKTLLKYNFALPDPEYVIPSGVTTIGRDAFNPGGKKSNLQTVIIPKSVVAIEENAFRNCNTLGSIDIPGSVKEIGRSAFEGCSILTVVTLHKGLEEIRPDAFVGTPLKSIDIPSSVKLISGGAFALTPIKSIDIPSSVKVIGKEAFAYCRQLSTVTLHEGLEEIGYQAFEDTSIKSVTVPRSVKIIQPFAFYSCESARVGKETKLVKCVYSARGFNGKTAFKDDCKIEYY